MSQGSVTRWISALKTGDEEAIEAIWQRFHRQLLALARKRLEASKRQEADEEDVVQKAFHSFCRGVQRGRFPDIHDRDNLWKILVVVTARKAIDQVRREKSGKRAGGTSDAFPTISPTGNLSDDDTMARVVGNEPTPELATQLMEQFQKLLDALEDESLRQVAVWKMDGYTNDEIADKLNCSRRTVARKLTAIRLIWQPEQDNAGTVE